MDNREIIVSWRRAVAEGFAVLKATRIDGGWAVEASDCLATARATGLTREEAEDKALLSLDGGRHELAQGGKRG